MNPKLPWKVNSVCDHKSTKREEIKISFSLKEKKSNLRMSVFLQENWIQSE
jgi:hypothetical protein